MPLGWQIAPDKRAFGHRQTDSRMVGKSQVICKNRSLTRTGTKTRAGQREKKSAEQLRATLRMNWSFG
jgi:hypothetical protein